MCPTNSSAWAARRQRVGRVASAASKKTDYAVVGEAGGKKADDARRLGVTMLDETEFLALVKQE